MWRSKSSTENGTSPTDMVSAINSKTESINCGFTSESGSTEDELFDFDLIYFSSSSLNNKFFKYLYYIFLIK